MSLDHVEWSLVYIEPDESDEETKTVKVKLPADLYLKLHSLKVLEGGTISERVEKALETHFEGTPFADLSES